MPGSKPSGTLADGFDLSGNGFKPVLAGTVGDETGGHVHIDTVRSIVSVVCHPAAEGSGFTFSRTGFTRAMAVLPDSFRWLSEMPCYPVAPNRYRYTDTSDCFFQALCQNGVVNVFRRLQNGITGTALVWAGYGVRRYAFFAHWRLFCGKRTVKQPEIVCQARYVGLTGGIGCIDAIEKRNRVVHVQRIL